MVVLSVGLDSTSSSSGTIVNCSWDAVGSNGITGCLTGDLGDVGLAKKQKI